MNLQVERLRRQGPLHVHARHHPTNDHGYDQGWNLYFKWLFTYFTLCSIWLKENVSMMPVCNLQLLIFLIFHLCRSKWFNEMIIWLYSQIVRNITFETFSPAALCSPLSLEVSSTRIQLSFPSPRTISMNSSER